MSSAANWLPEKPVMQQVGRDLGLILGLALLIRILTFNGAFGSDDLTYFQRALEISKDEWTSANYNGALRYGFNLPAAGFIALFGDSLAAANLWPLVCSLIEIAAVYLFANAAVGVRAGLYSALLLAFAPLHIAVATRIHADPVVSMFVTVGFVLFYFGATRRSSPILFAAGLSIGCIFWAKELAAVIWFAFLPMLWLLHRQWQKILYVISGVALMLVLHGLLMLAIAGDPLHLVKLVFKAVKLNFIDAGKGEDGAAYYLRYLFLDLRHTGLLGYLALAALFFIPAVMVGEGSKKSGFAYALVWWISILIILSLFPVSLSPLRLTMKQSNYITLFLAPTALLAGIVLSMLSRTYGKLLLGISLLIGIFLGAMQQADYRVFTANSKALAVFSVQHPNALIIGSTNNSRMGTFWAQRYFPNAPHATIASFIELNELGKSGNLNLPEAKTLFAVIDLQTIGWVAEKNPLKNALPCWLHEKTLEPIELGMGNQLAKLTNTLLSPLLTPLSLLAHPQRADVYRIQGDDVLCRSAHLSQ